MRGPVDLVVLDWLMLPGEDGLAVCKRLAASEGPGRDHAVRHGRGDRTGSSVSNLYRRRRLPAPSPCNPRELLARVRAVLRRRGEQSQRSDSQLGATCEFAGWRLDLVRRELRSPDGVMVNLSGGEFSLLRAFVERPQRGS